MLLYLSLKLYVIFTKKKHFTKVTDISQKALGDVTSAQEPHKVWEPEPPTQYDPYTSIKLSFQHNCLEYNYEIFYT